MDWIWRLQIRTFFSGTLATFCVQRLENISVRTTCNIIGGVATITPRLQNLTVLGYLYLHKAFNTVICYNRSIVNRAASFNTLSVDCTLEFTEQNSWFSSRFVVFLCTWSRCNDFVARVTRHSDDSGYCHPEDGSLEGEARVDDIPVFLSALFNELPQTCNLRHRMYSAWNTWSNGVCRSILPFTWDWRKSALQLILVPKVPLPLLSLSQHTLAMWIRGSQHLEMGCQPHTTEMSPFRIFG